MLCPHQCEASPNLTSSIPARAVLLEPVTFKKKPRQCGNIQTRTRPFRFCISFDYGRAGNAVTRDTRSPPASDPGAYRLPGTARSLQYRLKQPTFMAPPHDPPTLRCYTRTQNLCHHKPGTPPSLPKGAPSPFGKNGGWGSWTVGTMGSPS